jgi:alpha-D-ribose 1-methylphosphonate 5-triphosphate synthase subunit PhnH
MRAMAEPGLPRHLPQAGAAVVAQTLLDRETSAHADDPAVLTGTGARAAPITQAEYVFAPATADVARALFTGDLLYPDAGATLIAPATLGAGTELRLTGPGIETQRIVQLGGIDPAFWDARRAAIRYPLPRSTTIEVLS